MSYEAFRRKGVSGSAAASGEAKWVREWTVHVEQFLEGVIATCGQQDWQKNMNYAVKLSTAFYAEKLLDADHYLDWIVSSLAEASSERLPHLDCVGSGILEGNDYVRPARTTDG